MSLNLEDLEDSLTGEVKTSHLDKLLHSGDASIYQELPLAIARPQNIEDCRNIVLWAQQNNQHLIPRGAGTSLAGQVVGSGLVVDMGRHLRTIHHIDAEEKSAWVDPGVILDNLNDKLKPLAFFLAPIPLLQIVV